ncbi:phage tail spike protein [Dolosigranulum savutiense]|uniref:Phage tail spike protein n=1 Tax=Dolosigranulum savutiense TaxID=3110288 RepID=A0AB74TTN5_9LACT
MIPVLFSKEEKQFRSYGIGPLFETLHAEVKRERNGQYFLYMTYPQNGQQASVFKEGMRIKADAGRRTPWQTFEITRINRRSDAIIEIWADHISMRLAKTMIKPKVEIHDVDAETALRRWVSQLVGDDEWEVWSNIDTVGSTAWSVDSVENARQALGGTRGSILDVWGGEFEFDNKRVNLWQNLGRKTPVVLEYGRNITKIEKENKEETVYTSIYPFARAEEDNIITIPNYIVDGKYIDMYDHKKIKLVDFSGEFNTEENKPTAEKLQKLAEKYVEQNDIGAPHEHIKIEYVDLSKTLDYQNVRYIEEVELCDRIPIYYPKFDIYSKEAKVIVITYNVIKDENKSIELGVIGQRFSSTVASSMSGNLPELERHYSKGSGSGAANSSVNSSGNKIWWGEPPENYEHKIGDVKFTKNGKYERMYIWDGSQWNLIVDTEHLNKVEKLIGDMEEYWRKADEAFEKQKAESERRLEEFHQSLEQFRQSLDENDREADRKVNEFRKQLERDQQERERIREENQSKMDEFERHLSDFEQQLKSFDAGMLEGLDQRISEALDNADISQKINERVRNIISDAGFGNALQDIEDKLEQTSQTARVNAEIIGGDGKTRYNKNRTDTTNATIQLETGYVEIGSNGPDGWPTDESGQLKELTISFEAECIPRGSSTVTVRLSTPLWYGAAIEMRPDSQYYPQADKKATAQATELFAVYNGQYTLAVDSPWFTESTTQRVTVDSNKTVTVSPRLKTIADGNLEAEFYGEWSENPEVILDGGS